MLPSCARTQAYRCSAAWQCSVYKPPELEPAKPGSFFVADAVFPDSTEHRKRCLPAQRTSNPELNCKHKICMPCRQSVDDRMVTQHIRQVLKCARRPESYRLGNGRVYRSHRDLPCCHFPIHVAATTPTCSLSAHDAHLLPTYMRSRPAYKQGILSVRVVANVDRNAMTTSLQLFKVEC